MSTRAGELCVLECFYCSFGDAGFKYSCMRSVRGRGRGTLGMSTRVGELCVVECVCCSVVGTGFTYFFTRRVHPRGGGSAWDEHSHQYIKKSKHIKYIRYIEYSK